MRSEQTDRVVIVGAGPVGLTLALVLARYQVASLVVEARTAPTPAGESRAITWMPRGLELLGWLGLSEPFAACGLRRRAHEFRAGGRLLLTTPFDRLPTPYPYTLQLPQHDTETLLEQAALATDLVEVRRGHRVTGVGRTDQGVTLEVATPAGPGRIAAPWGVGCDGARSRVRRALGIVARHRDYGTHSAVADFELANPGDPARSWIDLDPRRPWGLFCLAPGRWRLVYRINRGEDPQAMVTEPAARRMLAERLPGAAPRRFLWASAFQLGQDQSETYRAGRWLLAGDAAHAMGPSAGAGMMLGVLGAWRLGWRLAAVVGGGPGSLLDDYDREQRAAAVQVQHDNARIFRNITLRNPALAAARARGLRLAGRVAGVPVRLAATEALLRVGLPVEGAADRPRAGELRPVRRLGAWVSGRRLPCLPLPDGGTTLELAGAVHACVPIGRADARAEARLIEAIRGAFPLPVTRHAAGSGAAAPWRAPAPRNPAVAVIRPDQEVAAVYSLSLEG